MTTRYATPRQIAFLRSLISEAIAAEHRVLPDIAADAEALYAQKYSDAAVAALTVRETSAEIDRVKARLAYLRAKVATSPTTAPATREPVEPGFYLLDDTVYRVVWNQPKTRTYAKALNLTTGQWAYAGGVVGRLTEALTPQEAGRRGRHHGRCCYCGKELADALSVERGIGPVCWNKHVA